MATFQAKISKSYRWRIGIVGIAALAFAAYCYYDGAVAYPAKKHKYDEFQRIQEENPEQYQKAWAEFAEEQGWSTDEPKEMTDWDIRTQYIMGAGCTVIGSFFFGAFLMMSRRYVKTDDEAVWDHKGNRAHWGQITDIDKSRWSTKGIGVINFDAGQGDRRIVLDDWKYDRNQTQRIMAHVEAKVLGENPAAPADETSAAAQEAEDDVETTSV